MDPEDVVATRLARYALTCDARDLWPEVSVAAFRACQEAVAGVAAGVLAGSDVPVTLAPPRGADARALGIAAMAAGMGPLLGYWVEVGKVRTDPALAERLAVHLEHGRRRAARMREELERVLAPLGERGIELVVLKGLDTGYRYFPEPGTRPTADIDLLVKPTDRRAAGQVLSSLGFSEEQSQQPQRGHWTLPSPGRVRSLEFAHADDPWHVDLHHSLDRKLAGGIVASVGALAPADVQPFLGFALPAAVLSPVTLLAFLAIHTSSHFYAMSSGKLVELALVIRRDFEGRQERWRAVGELLARHGSARFAYPALSLAERLLPGLIDPGVLGALRAATPSRLRRLVGGLDPGTAQRLHPYPLAELLVWAASPGQVIGAALRRIWPRTNQGFLSRRQVATIYRVRLFRTGIALARSLRLR